MNFHQIIGIVLLISLSIIVYFIFKYMINQSKKFWNAAELLEKKIQNTNNISELEKMYEEDYKKLQDLSCGGIHDSNLSLLFGMLKGKIEGLKNKM